MVPGGYPGMTLLPQQPGAPPIMVPIIPSTGAHLMAQQQQIRLAVAHAQAAAAAQTARVNKHIDTSILDNNMYKPTFSKILTNKFYNIIATDITWTDTYSNAWNDTKRRSFAIHVR